MSKKEIVKRIALVAGIVAVISLLTVFFVAGARKSQEPTDAPPAATQVSKTGKPLNILFLGEDRTSGLHDVLMLLHVDLDAQRAVILQIPRDTYAAYHDGSYRKLNGASRALGGAESLCDFLSQSFGIAIDRYVSLDADVLSEVVDAIGGVEITLPDALHYEDPAQSLSIHLPAGAQTLDGKTAEYFVRYRMGYVRGDLGRMDAQKLFLAALAKKIKVSMSLSSALQLAATLLPKTDTNLTLFESAGLLRAAYAMEEENVLLLTAPGEEAIATQSGASYYALSSPAMNEVLAHYFGAANGNFDPDRRFCNARYRHFCEIYDGYRSYEVYSMGALVGEGIEIEKTSG